MRSSTRWRSDSSNGSLRCDGPGARSPCGSHRTPRPSSDSASRPSDRRSCSTMRPSTNSTLPRSNPTERPMHCGSRRSRHARDPNSPSGHWAQPTGRSTSRLPATALNGPGWRHWQPSSVSPTGSASWAGSRTTRRSGSSQTPRLRCTPGCARRGGLRSRRRCCPGPRPSSSTTVALPPSLRPSPIPSGSASSTPPAPMPQWSPLPVPWSDTSPPSATTAHHCSTGPNSSMPSGRCMTPSSSARISPTGSSRSATTPPRPDSIRRCRW